MNWNNAQFVKSAAAPSGFVEDSVPKLVFAGRSNVGKSSVINRVTMRKNFARVGKTPGKTVHINYFKIDGRAWVVDLPGYGYAQVSMDERKRWAKLMESFFATQEIRLGVLVVDARHAPTADDISMAEAFRSSGRPFIVVANKCDKLRPTQLRECLAVIAEKLDVEPIPFSAEKGTGREILIKRLETAVSGGQVDA